MFVRPYGRSDPLELLAQINSFNAERYIKVQVLTILDSAFGPAFYRKQFSCHVVIPQVDTLRMTLSTVHIG